MHSALQKQLCLFISLMLKSTRISGGYLFTSACSFALRVVTAGIGWVADFVFASVFVPVLLMTSVIFFLSYRGHLPQNGFLFFSILFLGGLSFVNHVRFLCLLMSLWKFATGQVVPPRLFLLLLPLLFSFSYIILCWAVQAWNVFLYPIICGV